MTILTKLMTKESTYNSNNSVLVALIKIVIGNSNSELQGSLLLDNQIRKEVSKFLSSIIPHSSIEGIEYIRIRRVLYFRDHGCIK